MTLSECALGVIFLGLIFAWFLMLSAGNFGYPEVSYVGCYPAGCILAMLMPWRPGE